MPAGAGSGARSPRTTTLESELVEADVDDGDVVEPSDAAEDTDDDIEDAEIVEDASADEVDGRSWAERASTPSDVERRRRARPRTRDARGRAELETSDAGAGGGVEDVQAIGPGDQADPVARHVGAEALGAGDDLRRGQLVPASTVSSVQ